eukprot:TRINITY_DN612_c0_g1_i11.p1 TRINITY_DN612_c0_g1~~TRINITY_DN612_c0_g1_i11.p1  ORF type:complete len:925 (+),score=189.40 TRINITY_DN612_c0_g1_i11:53-2776(+)
MPPVGSDDDKQKTMCSNDEPETLGLGVEKEVVDSMISSEKLTKEIDKCQKVTRCELKSEFCDSTSDPTITMLGPQSAGKSSLTDALMGRSFSYIFKKTGTKRPNHIFCKTSTTGETILKIDGEVVESFEALKEKVEKKHSHFTKEKVLIEIEAPDVPTVAFVDLPGIRSGEADDDSRMIAEITEEYVMDESNTLLCVMRAPNDVASWLDFDCMKKYLSKRPNWRESCLCVCNRFGNIIQESNTAEGWNEYFKNLKEKTGNVIVTTMGYPVHGNADHDEWVKNVKHAQKRDAAAFAKLKATVGEGWDDTNDESTGLVRLSRFCVALLQDGSFNRASTAVERTRKLQSHLDDMLRTNQEYLDQNNDESVRKLMTQFAAAVATHMRALHDNSTITDSSRSSENTKHTVSYNPSELPGLSSNFFEDVKGLGEPHGYNFTLSENETMKLLGNHHLKEQLGVRTFGKFNIQRLLNMVQWFILRVETSGPTKDDISTNGSMAPNIDIVYKSARDMILKLGDGVIPWLVSGVEALERKNWDHVTRHLLQKDSMFGILGSDTEMARRFHGELEKAYFKMLRECTDRIREDFTNLIEDLSVSLSLDLLDREIIGVMMSINRSVPVIDQQYDTTALKVTDSVKDLVAKLKATSTEPLRLGVLHRHISELPLGYFKCLSQLLYDTGCRHICKWLHIRFCAKVMPIFTGDQNNLIVNAVITEAVDNFMKDNENCQELINIDVDAIRAQMKQIEVTKKAAKEHEENSKKVQSVCKNSSSTLAEFKESAGHAARLDSPTRTDGVAMSEQPADRVAQTPLVTATVIPDSVAQLTPPETALPEPTLQNNMNSSNNSDNDRDNDNEGNNSNSNSKRRGSKCISFFLNKTLFFSLSLLLIILIPYSGFNFNSVKSQSKSTKKGAKP